MISSLRCAQLSMCVLIGFAGACASGNTPPETASSPAVTAADIEHGSTRAIEDVLQAKSPGVLITRAANGGIAVRIRGISSFYSSNEPLYVIDGTPFRPGPGGALTDISPYDIESIQVLKNPEDTGIWGIRGANGVIVVKTKHSGKSVPPELKSRSAQRA